MRVSTAMMVAAAIVAGGVLAFAAVYGALTGTPPEDRMPEAYETRSPPRPGLPVAEGGRLYGEQCAGCHGEHGRGDGPLARRLETAPAALQDAAGQSDAWLFWRISEGKPGTTMPAFENTLSTEQRWAVVRYLREHLLGPAHDHSTH